MESPVMTSASSHRLRSAVSACAQPTHSYLSSTYLGTGIQCESHSSGGCLKKFRNGESSLLDKLNITKKSQSGSSEISLLYKRQKLGSRSSLNHGKTKSGNVSEKEIVNSSSSNGLLNIIQKQFLIGNDLLSKLKLHGSNIVNSRRLPSYLEKGPKCEKVISGKGSNKSSNSGNKKNVNDGSRNKVLNHFNGNCNKSKNRNPDLSSLFVGKRDSINDGSEHGDECSKRGVGHLNERQEISKWQPKHVVTRRTAQIVREIRNAWESRVGSSRSVPAENVQLLFNDLHLYPTASQVSKMLECKKKCSENLSSVTFNDFYRITNSFIKGKGCKALRTSPLSNLSKNVDRRNRKFSKGMSKYEVFLGGSCNPTTWRTDIAIPELEAMGISYYNPQVDEWRPELLEVEYHAKENATVMFFVIDNQTRGVSALIEVAHLAGNRRKLILVIQSYTKKNQIICDEEISQLEYEDLKMGQDVLQDLVERQGIPVFDDIRVALRSTEKILRENLTVQDLQDPVQAKNTENSLNLQEVFEKLDSTSSGEITGRDACLALKMLTGRDVSVGHLQYFITNSEYEMNGTNLEDIKFDFLHFSELICEFQRQHEGRMSLDSSLFSQSVSVVRDVYLGGTIENTTWRETIAIPKFQSCNVTFFVPKIREETKRFTDVEASAMENSFILLFVITGTARSIAAMAIAGHYIGKGANVVLCVQHLPEGATIGDEKLSECALKDYNRGRMYLMDIAERNGVPVFHDISTVVNYVVEECRKR